MSKHIWRIQRRKILDVAAWEPASDNDCTVIMDKACFPVREARRFIREMHRIHYEAPLVSECPARCAVIARYEKAVARMKAKKAVRK